MTDCASPVSFSWWTVCAIYLHCDYQVHLRVLTRNTGEVLRSTIVYDREGGGGEGRKSCEDERCMLRIRCGEGMPGHGVRWQRSGSVGRRGNGTGEYLVLSSK